MGIWQLVAVAAVALVVVVAGWVGVREDWLGANVRAALRRRVTYVVGIPTLALMFLVGVPYVYLQAVTDPPPPPLTFADIPGMVPSTTLAPTVDAASAAMVAAPDLAAGPSTTLPATSTTLTTTSPAPPASAIEGSWKVGSGSQARYGIDDTILGQTERVVGSTDQVSGTMQATGTRVTAVEVVVDMRSVHCDCVHDDKYHDLLATDRYPTSTFTLDEPIDLGPTLPAEGTIIEVPVVGTFTIRGVARVVRFTVEALRSGGRIAVNGVIPIRLEDYRIENPDAGAFGGLSNPAIELLVAFDRA